MKHRPFIVPFVLFCVLVIFAGQAEPSDRNKGNESNPGEDATLVRAVLCETIRDLAPVNRAAVFSISKGEVACFSSFDPVLRETFIYHKWYSRDKLSTQKKLHLKPPKWSAYSKIQLREMDKGPWRVDVVDGRGSVLTTLRFSVTD